MNDGIDGRVALVTGAAQGIGATVARALAEEGATVVGVDQDADGVDAVARELREAGCPARGERLDVTDAPAVDELVERVERTVAPIDILVNVAGVLRLGRATELSKTDWDAMFAVNTAGVFHCCRAVAGPMSRRGSGAVVTVTSNAGSVPRMHMSGYGASKAASASFTKSLGLELAEYGVRCNVVAPGSTDTEMLRSMWTGDSGKDATLDGTSSEYRIGIPLRKLGEPRDVADAVSFLCSSRSGHITMQEFCVDGGAALGP